MEVISTESWNGFGRDAKLTQIIAHDFEELSDEIGHS